MGASELPPRVELPARGRLLAIDPGGVRTGLALSDPSQTLASPLAVIPTRKRPALVAALLARAREEEAAGLLVGVPIRADGGVGAAAERSLALLRALRAAGELPVDYLDERATTQDAERAFIEAGVRASDRRGRVDMVAAAVLLRAYLDGRR